MAVGPAHNPEPAPEDWPIDATSRYFKRWRHLVTPGFQVKTHSVENHGRAINVRHIFDDHEPSLGGANDSEHFRPKIAVVACPPLFARNRKGLAGETAGKNGEVIRQSSKPGPEGETSDSGEKVDLSCGVGNRRQINVLYASTVNNPLR
jgi:hypothetical protein